MSRKNKGNRLSKTIVITVIAGLVGLVSFYSCHNSLNNQQNPEVDNSVNPDTTVTAEDISQGRKLALNYCSSCHMFPEPKLITPAKWKNVLPQMGIRLGIKEHRGVSYTSSVKGPDLVVPAKPILNDRQWQNILDYYMNEAPVKLPPQNRSVVITREMPFFALQSPSNSFSSKTALATYVKIDNSVKPARLFVGNGITNKLYLLSNRLKVIDSISTSGPVVDIAFNRGQFLVCMIGKELGANSDKLGSVEQLFISKSGKMKFDAQPLFSKLARPVQVVPADLNGDCLTDYLICEFGSLTGELIWMENKGNSSFTKHIISTLPGAIKAYVDYPAKNSVPSLWVLFAQGEEGIYHFTNKGNGTFEEKRVLRFPPIYGSSFFERVDVNHDGFKDIVYTCGDNGNATQVLKPYHGVYIFLNDGHENYKQKYFYPINGCYKAFARDFDGHGNIDIATVSLFTDARQPEEGFVYLKNLGNLDFKPFALPRDTRFERAVTMDEGDYNGDGKPDLLIGNSFFDFGPFGYNIAEPLFYVLKNVAR